MDFFDRVLKALGLITIKRARGIHVEIVACRERMIAEDVTADFGVKPKPDFEDDIRKWASSSFDTGVLTVTRKRPLIVSDVEYQRLLDE